MIIKLVLCVVWLVLIPTVLGMLYGYGKPQEKNNSILLFLVGYCIAFAIFEILAIPMTFLQCKFTTLVSVYEIILLLLSIISIILNRKNLKIFFKTNIQTIKKMPLSTILVVVLILLQVIIVFRYMHVDDDDAFFVGNATTSIASNTISKINPSTGYGWGWQARYVLAPFSLYLATISQFLQIHPAIVAHTIFPVVFIPMTYMVFGLIANKLFNQNKKQVMLFLFVLIVLYTFGNYSRRTTFSVLFLRIWQGKAFLANIIIPLIWYFVITTMEEDHSILDFCVLLLVMISACLVSSMGVPLAPITLMSLIMVYVIRDRKIHYLFKYFIPCIPCVICGIVYLFLQ